MNTNSAIQCPVCGRTLTSSLKGLCPDCLALVGFGKIAPSSKINILDPVPEVDSTSHLPLSPILNYMGDYELQAEVARGGMGVIYRARQVSLNRIVAVKMILGGQFATDADVNRFRAEAEAAANLQHPNIVAIHETGEHEGRHYFSMDYVEGKNLAQELNGEAMDPVKAADLLKTIAEAMHYAHQRGTLHRDLKPSNILIDSCGQPRITDFGLAKQILRDSGLTQAGVVMGSPSYMPPEQAAGRQSDISVASDVYSLGAVFYHMLTGQPPFSGNTPLETMRQVVECEPQAPSKLNPAIPPDLETICMKCLEKRPERRFRSAQELDGELGRFLRQEPILGKPSSSWRRAWSWSHRNPWAVVGLVAGLGILLLGLADGLWERIQFLEWKNAHYGMDKTRGQYYVHLRDPSIIQIIGLIVMVPAIFLSRFVKKQRQQKLPTTHVPLRFLGALGLLLVALGLYADMLLIQIYVWTKVFGFLSTLGLCLGVPLVFCWLGGSLTWQAFSHQHSLWSGSTAAAKDWLPLRPRAYSMTKLILANIVNLGLFALLACVAVRFGSFDDFFRHSGRTSEALRLFVTAFIFIAYAISFACWIYATRNVNPRPLLVTGFILTLYAGAALAWVSLLPFAFLLMASLSGLVGGLILAGMARIQTPNLRPQ